MSQPVTLTEKIKKCRTPMEALLLLASAIDELRSAPADPWQQPLQWDTATQQRSGPGPSQTEILNLKQRMGYVTDKDELKSLAAKLWLLENPGQVPDGELDAGHAEQQDGDDVILPTPDAGRMLTRRNFAKAVQLHTFFTPEQAEDEVAYAYAKGGPLWLYNAAREIVMALPFGARRQMVEDIEQDSPRRAHEVGRDILKMTEGVSMANQFEAAGQKSEAWNG